VKKLYKEYKDRKELLKAHSHFICDANIMGQLYNLLGKVFSEKNNYPIPMNYGSPTSLADGIKKVVDSTYMHLKGKSITIRFGHTSMRSNDVVENIKVGLEFALQKIQNGWKDIQSIHVKTAYSSALPVYSKNKSESLEFIKSQVKGGESSAKAKGESAAKVKESAAKVKESAAKVKEEGSVKTVTSKKSDNKKEAVNEKEPAKKKGGKDTRPVSAQSPVGTKIVDKKNKKIKK
jgi:ribosome biogenesis protein UTP30